MGKMHRQWVALLLAMLASASTAQTTAPDAPPTLKLPTGARPLRYDVILTVVPGEARVSGEVAIDVELERPHAVLWLNREALEVKQVATGSPDTRVTVLPGNDQFVGVAFEPPLPAGQHRVTLVYEADQARNAAQGIFALEDSGEWYAATQFEPLSARRAFPCFDEPGFKTPWQLTLRVPRNLVAVSNTHPVSQATGDDGLTTVRFAQTRPLPSYLVAFAVGPWQFVDLGTVDGVPTRIVVPRGRVGDAQFIARAYPELFSRMQSWFGIAYPYGKLDHVGIPLSVNFAMENVGLITYGAPLLLASPGSETAGYRRFAASVGAHEISHQWFGNLVTTAWWDDIWLNEAFATWIAAKIVDQWRPDYDRGASRVYARATAIEADGLMSARQIRQPVNSSGDVYNAFDEITYQKGATVIGMFEGWIGEARFQTGVRRYLEARSDGSATAEDFLASLTQASGLPIAPAFDSFLNQNGVPRIDVELRCAADGAQLRLEQRRHALLGAAPAAPQRWQIPACVRYGSGAASREACVLMTEATATVPLEGACPAFVFANAGGRGYYLPSYPDGLLKGLARHRNQLTVPEYASLLHDLQALARGGQVSLPQVLAWARLGAASSDRHVVLAAVNLAEFAGNVMIDESGRAQFSRYVREVFGPRARALGFTPRNGESDDVQLMRRALLAFVAPEDPALAAQARRLARAWIGDRKAVDPSLVEVVLVTAARTGDAAMFEVLYAEAKSARDPRDRRYLRTALFAFTDPGIAGRGLSVLLDPAFDVRESWAALYMASKWDPARRAPNDYIMANFDALAKTVSNVAPSAWPYFASGLCREDDGIALAAFWKDRLQAYPGADRQLALAQESIEACVRLRAAQARQAKR